MSLLTFFEIILLILTIASIVFYLFCAFATYYFFRIQQQAKTDFSPPISLMIPVCGLDTGAWENWLSFAQQDYPEYEILFGVRDLDDPAIPVLKKLSETFSVQVRLYTNLTPLGANHKDSILNYLLAEAKHEYLVFADSDIRVTSDYLQKIIAPLADAKVGLVTCAFIGRKPQTLGAAVASFGRCFDFIPSALIAKILDGGVKFAVGATLVTRKENLAKAGGLQFNRIGSDYNLAKRIVNAGDRVELSHYILESDTGAETLLDVITREIRWARTIRFNRGSQYYGMVFCFGTIYSLLLLLVTGFSQWAIIITLLTGLIRYVQVIFAIVCLNAPQLWPWLWSLPLRDFLSLIIWLLGAFGQQVFWRGRYLQIKEDGIIQDRLDGYTKEEAHLHQP
ncbi:glycosyl transferase [Aphanothece hegewaldii CCALA 016]|uniref:Glycosyl transferase n=1 Tax=Aphanothece hegewaldii CCALA 016 TaxID=2107694 RepID=A0A2T1M236_9CHRO|nr:glycosyltransferase [Aphanothece hegewaldii]PSF38786.1 glycosyl transferase [Aphanothece hegewaldii CCALA 016]